MVAAQAPVNAGLARIVGDPILAACFSFAVGFAALTLASLARGRFPALSTIGTAPWWAWTGGLFGAFYVAWPQLGAFRSSAP